MLEGLTWIFQGDGGESDFSAPQRVEEALKGLLAGSIPCRGFCSMGKVRVLTF
jgi:hypothetical protein